MFRGKPGAETHQGFTPWRRMASCHKLIELIMTTLSKTLLAVAITGMAAGGILDFGGCKINPAWTVALPLGAIAYGMFLISFMLEKEVAGFDEDAAKELRWIKDAHLTPAPKPKAAVGRIIIPLPAEKFGH
jgi:hypothetical protein